MWRCLHQFSVSQQALRIQALQALQEALVWELNHLTTSKAVITVNRYKIALSSFTSTMVKYYGEVLWWSTMVKYYGEVLWWSTMVKYYGEVLWWSTMVKSPRDNMQVSWE